VHELAELCRPSTVLFSGVVRRADDLTRTGWSGPPRTAKPYSKPPSGSTVSRILSRDVIKPWQCRSWISPRDPYFARKAGRVLDLYDRRRDGQRLRDDEYVISADEKSHLQALRRVCPDTPAAPGRARRQSSSMNGAGRWPTSLPTTSTGARSGAGAPRQPGSSRSPPSSSRS